ncbi:enoyl-CoA hydratase/isomerase family protein [Paraburkholderia sabiae]|uniref:Enoyl-CoA hydratase-related protein n=1 Tax=Paraburkholderia sabiae TaxID=273251 RepID=A0ABU9QJ00_9BURK|nr:enoyl-CoA hydratase-related protein [Paraburkholderia sabiae]WJZ77438.1 enoyl-CoA hydratase-related protein [Paraburkholderia sabiae]CAD6557824.1 2,3-dehydroadipyl-CoA hydratase [Paraburkholderia sabiae]
MTSTASDNDPILLTSTPAPGVMLLQLNRPHKLNALSLELLGALQRALTSAERNDDIKCVILTGSGRAFCAGADISDMGRGIGAYEDPRRLAAQDAISAFSKPLIAAINGYVLGGGLELAMTCDIAIAAEDAKLGLPEINLGAFPGDGGTQRLPRIIGKSLAMQMILTGEAISASEARRIGLVSEVTASDELLPRALGLATIIAGKSPQAVRIAKQAVLNAFDMPLSAGLKFERTATAAVFATEDRAEAIRAFTEKRAPVFKGR